MSNWPDLISLLNRLSASRSKTMYGRYIIAMFVVHQLFLEGKKKTDAPPPKADPVAPA